MYRVFPIEGQDRETRSGGVAADNDQFIANERVQYEINKIRREKSHSEIFFSLLSSYVYEKKYYNTLIYNGICLRIELFLDVFSIKDKIVVAQRKNSRIVLSHI